MKRESMLSHAIRKRKNKKGVPAGGWLWWGCTILQEDLREVCTAFIFKYSYNDSLNVYSCAYPRHSFASSILLLRIIFLSFLLMWKYIA